MRLRFNLPVREWNRAPLKFVCVMGGPINNKSRPNPSLSRGRRKSSPSPAARFVRAQHQGCRLDRLLDDRKLSGLRYRRPTGLRKHRAKAERAMRITIV